MADEKKEMSEEGRQDASRERPTPTQPTGSPFPTPDRKEFSPEPEVIPGQPLPKR